uniref:Sulfotransferase domain-containing protein n=1 Tax=Ditylenchus dipsaci TaxID=166011 RepID=A0A915EK20_9BILA
MLLAIKGQCRQLLPLPSNVSFSRRQKNLSWNDFFALYLNGTLYCGSWFEHVLGYWKFAKGMTRSPVLDFKLDDVQMAKVLQHCTFDSMKDNKMANRDFWLFDQTVSKFMRKGQIGDWKNYFSIAQAQVFDELYEKRMLGTGLNFRFD